MCHTARERLALSNMHRMAMLASLTFRRVIVGNCLLGKQVPTISFAHISAANGQMFSFGARKREVQTRVKLIRKERPTNLVTSRKCEAHTKPNALGLLIHSK